MIAWSQRLDGPVWARLRDPKSSGIAGIVLGVFACLLTIPPVAARSIVWSVLFGVAAAMLGVWTVTHGRGRLGWVGQTEWVSIRANAVYDRRGRAVCAG